MSVFRCYLPKSREINHEKIFFVKPHAHFLLGHYYVEASAKLNGELKSWRSFRNGESRGAEPLDEQEALQTFVAIARATAAYRWVLSTTESLRLQFFSLEPVVKQWTHAVWKLSKKRKWIVKLPGKTVFLYILTFSCGWAKLRAYQLHFTSFWKNSSEFGLFGQCQHYEGYFGQISEFLTVSNRIWDALVVQLNGRCKDLQVEPRAWTQEKNNEMRDTDIVCRCSSVATFEHTAHVNSTNQ